MATKQEILDAIQQDGSQIRVLGVKRMGLFGSFARGQQQAGDKVDILVEFEPDQRTFDHLTALSSLLEETLGRNVELVTPESLSPYVRPYILSEVEYVFLAT